MRDQRMNRLDSLFYVSRIEQQREKLSVHLLADGNRGNACEWRLIRIRSYAVAESIDDCRTAGPKRAILV